MPTSTRVQLPAWILQMQAPSRGSRHRGKDYFNAKDAYFRRDRMTQLIKCTPWSMRLCPHPTIVNKNENFLGGGKQNGTDNPSASQPIQTSTPRN